MKLRAAIFGATLLGIAGLFLSAREPRVTPESLAALSPAAPRAESSRSALHGLVGVNTCSGGGCHGDPSRDPKWVDVDEMWRGSYLAWVENDPHGAAWTVLLEERSQLIVNNLADMQRGPAEQRLTPEMPEYRAWLFRACANCHTTASDAKAEPAQVAAGVACESCHGKALGWVDTHYMAGQTRKQMTEVWKLDVRANVCVQCHVGPAPGADPSAPAQEVNHALIAAGHPRLNFELKAYHDAYPSHWNTARDRKFEYKQKPVSAGTAAGAAATTSGSTSGAGSVGPDRPRVNFSAELWLAGQRAVARQSLTQLAWRGERAEASWKNPATDAPAGPHVAPDWPEFAEYDCFACHHRLEPSNFRRQGALIGLTKGVAGKEADGYRPGALRWGEWTLPHLREVAVDPATVDEQLTALRTNLLRPVPNTSSVAGAARALALAVAGEGGVASGPGEAGVLLDRVVRTVADPKRAQWRNWDQAAQWYLAAMSACDAIEESDASSETAEWLTGQRDKLRELAGRLEFRVLSDATTYQWDGPNVEKDFDPSGEELRKLRNGIRSAFSKRPEWKSKPTGDDGNE